MLKKLLIAIIITANPLLVRAVSSEATLTLVPVPEAAERAEIRATNSSGTLAAGNLQFPAVDGLIVSKPVFWLKNGDSWVRQDLPGLNETGGFYTISAINTGSEFWLVGRAWSGSKVEGYAYNYVSRETVWGGQLENDLTNVVASRFTGVSSQGKIFSGTASRNNAVDAPVIYDYAGGGGLQVVPVADGYDGGWLYSLAGEDENTVGVGFLYKWNVETEEIERYPARWTQAEGLVPLELLAPGKTGSVLSISADGTMGLGLAVADDGIQYPTVWHLDEGGSAEALPLPEGQGYLYGQADSVDPVSGWISGAVYYDDNPDDEVPGDFQSVIWDANRQTRSGKTYLKNRYKVDFGDVNVRTTNWIFSGGGFTGAYTDPQGEVKAYMVEVRSRAAGFEFVDPMSGGSYYAEARAVSDDGQVVAGLASGFPSGEIAAVWKSGSGWQHVGMPEGAIYTPYFLTASDMTPDGSVVVGRNPSDTGFPIGFVWNQGATSFHRLFDQAGAFSRLTGVSADGRTAVGQSSDASGNQHAYVVRDGTTQALAYPQNAAGSWAYDVSGDGALAAGWYTDGNGNSHPLLWDLGANTFTELDKPAGALSAEILAVSGDGSVLVGGARFDEGGTINQVPVFWNADRQPVLIPSLGEFRLGSAWSVTADGSMIVGQMLDDGFTASRGFIYTEETGTLDIHQYYLKELGVYLDQDYKPGIIYVSSNGRWFCGSGPDASAVGSRLGFKIKVPVKQAADSFGSDVAAYGDTGFVDTWFGLVKDESYPLVHHREHGWLEMSIWGPDGGYYYDLELGWVFVDRSQYPLMRILPDGKPSKWVYYELDSVSPRRFFDYETQSWKTAAELGN